MARIFTLLLFTSLSFPFELRTEARLLNQKDSDWTEITKLYSLGWEQLKKGKLAPSKSAFQKAANKLKRYRNTYIKDSESLSFMRATYQLGHLNDLANNDAAALSFYYDFLSISERQVVDSKKINTSTAELVLLREYTELRIQVIKNGQQTTSESALKTFPRASIRGGSKGTPRHAPKQETLMQP